MPVVPPATSQNYPTLLGVMNLVRAILNDAFAGATGTPGEGQIVTDDQTISPATLPFLNSAIREVYRRLRTVGSPTLIKDNYILTGLAAVDGPLGSGVPDPTIQVRLGFDGYDDGSGSVNTTQTLPSDLIMPIKLWSRESGTEDDFIPMTPSENGLSPCDQVDDLMTWEWRSDSIFMPGALTSQDLRIRYQAYMPEFFGSSLNFATTQIPIFDCDEAVAYLTAAKEAASLGGPAAMMLKAEADRQVYDLRNEIVRNMQKIPYRRRPYGNDDANVWFYPYSV